MTTPSTISVKKRLFFVLIIFSTILFLLITRVGWLQFVRGAELQKRAYQNQTQGNILNPPRGTIYDRNKNELVTSVSVETVTVDPNEIRKSKTTKPEDIAKLLSEILDMNYDEVYKIIIKRSNSEFLKRKVEKSVTDKIRQAKAEKKLPGVIIVDDKKRFYKYGSFASQVIGFTGFDNQGLTGIELKYDKYLRGSQGRLLFTKDGVGREIPYSDEEYVTPKNGDNVYLTIDEVIQHFAEKALETAVANNKVKKGTVIVMDPKTGEILALAVKPDFDLNNPFVPLDEELKNTWETLESKDKNIILQDMWRNPAISDTYEPGSTFKIITSAAALEESVVKPDDMFNCVGYVKVGGYKIKCWRSYNPHGIETFVQGVQNSCNPVFMEVAQRLGTEKFYNYIKGFGLMQKTNIDLPGETPDMIFHKLSAMGPVELATYSFGQGFQVTPLGMITAISSVANDGKLLRPTIVKKIEDGEGNIVMESKPQFVRQVISQDTSKVLRDILESVVTVGTGKGAYIKGYRVAGKTGTSEKLPRGNGKYVASFAGFAPADDPRIAVLVVLDEPAGDVYFGGQIAAPVVGEIIDDTLRYLNVEPKYSENEAEDYIEITVPDIRDMSINEAKNTLAGIGLQYKLEGSGDKVIEQMPKAGIKIYKDSPVFIFSSKINNTKVKVPDVTGKTMSDASKALAGAGLGIKIVGSGLAINQNPAPGSQIDIGTSIEVHFNNTDILD